MHCIKIFWLPTGKIVLIKLLKIKWIWLKGKWYYTLNILFGRHDSSWGFFTRHILNRNWLSIVTWCYSNCFSTRYISDILYWGALCSILIMRIAWVISDTTKLYHNSFDMHILYICERVCVDIYIYYKSRNKCAQTPFKILIN